MSVAHALLGTTAVNYRFKIFEDTGSEWVESVVTTNFLFARQRNTMLRI